MIIKKAYKLQMFIRIQVYILGDQYLQIFILGDQYLQI